MSGFSSRWLDLREPVDHAARSENVISALCHCFLNHDRIAITDIGSGTGSTIRALKSYLPDVAWHLIDHDDSLLQEARKHAAGQAVEFTKVDLSENLAPIASPRPDIVTTSAFLDLVSADWLERLVAFLKQEKLPFYAALTYDGRAFTTPHCADEEQVIAAFNQHQKTDKGFGPALGPQAASLAVRLFEEAGYVVTCDPSDWNASAKHADFQKMLLEGWKNAATEIIPGEAAKIDKWFDGRVRLINEGRLETCVGHVDFLAIPEGA